MSTVASTTPLSAPPSASATQSPRRQPRILIVEDTPVINEVYANFLARDNWTNITRCYHGRNAILAIQECAEGKAPLFDIIITDDDLKSAGITGMDILWLAKRACPNASMFMIATDPSNADLEELRRMKILFFQKPIPMATFRTLIEESVKLMK